MESVGQKLHVARTEAGLTLEEISAKTRISVRNLLALETDDLTAFTSAFFYKSFVRQFAQQVKIDYQDLAPDVQAVTSTMPEPLMPGQAELASHPKVPALRSSRPKKLRWLYSLTSLLVMLIACSSVYDIWQKTRSQLQLPPAHQSADLAVRVQLSAIERSWLSTTEDGVQTFNGVLEADHTKFIEGHETARIRTANAGGLDVVFNGKKIGSLGARGQVRTVVFTKNGYRTVDSAPSPAAHLLLTPFIPTGE